MFILTRRFRQARINTYSSDAISAFCQNDPQFARYTYRNHASIFNNLSDQQKAQIIQAHSTDKAFFNDIGIPLLLKPVGNNYPVFNLYRQNFTYPQTRQPWYKRWFSFGSNAPEETSSAFAFVQQHSTPGAIDVADFIKSSDLHKNAEAEVMALALKDAGLIASSWNDLVELAKKNSAAAKLFFQSEEVRARFSKGNFSNGREIHNALNLYDQFTDIVKQQSELKPDVQRLQKTIEKNLISILDWVDYIEASYIHHQRACWELFKDSPQLISHRNNPFGVKIQEYIECVAPPSRVWGKKENKEPKQPEQLIESMVDLTMENNAYAQQLLSHAQASERLSEKQVLQILSAHTNNRAFLNTFLAPNAEREPMINLYALVMKSKDAADLMIKHSVFIHYLSLDQLQTLKTEYYNQPLASEHFQTLGLNTPAEQTAANVKKQHIALNLKYHPDKYQKGDRTGKTQDINNARDKLKPLEHMECINTLIAEKETAERRAAAAFGRFYQAPKTDSSQPGGKGPIREKSSKP